VVINRGITVLARAQRQKSNVVWQSAYFSRAK